MTQREQYTPRPADTPIPRAVTEITIKRSEYNDTVYVAMKSGMWSASFTTQEEHLYTRLHEIAAEMERTPL